MKTDIPVYMGEIAYSIASASARYMKNKKKLSFDHVPLIAGRKVARGDIAITPFPADHSAYDSYMFLAEAEGRKILYTGDFRSNGRKSFDDILSDLPRSIDALVCEGTTLSGTLGRNMSEGIDDNA
jgi:ribonuclease J